MVARMLEMLPHVIAAGENEMAGRQACSQNVTLTQFSFFQKLSNFIRYSIQGIPNVSHYSRLQNFGILTSQRVQRFHNPPFKSKIECAKSTFMLTFFSL